MDQPSTCSEVSQLARSLISLGTQLRDRKRGEHLQLGSQLTDHPALTAPAAPSAAAVTTACRSRRTSLRASASVSVPSSPTCAEAFVRLIRWINISRSSSKDLAIEVPREDRRWLR